MSKIRTYTRLPSTILGYLSKNEKQARSSTENCKELQNHYGLENCNSLDKFGGEEKYTCGSLDTENRRGDQLKHMQISYEMILVQRVKN